MTTQHHDVVIVGAGPAGMGAAISLIKQGRDICALDRATFPRSKTCAGLVTDKTYRLIEALIEGDTDPLFCYATDTIRILNKTELLVETKLERPIRLVNRSSFDSALVEEYKRLGGLLREGVTILAIDYECRMITLSCGDALHYGMLLFADGALSLAHKGLKIDRRKLSFGVESYVPADQLTISSVDLDFGYLNSGYAWVFPHGETVCVGAANLYDKNTDYRKTLGTYLTDLGVNLQEQKYIGAFLPYGEIIPQDKLPENVLLLGDAGGFTDPITGEGLYMALQTGIFAAKALSAPTPKKAFLQMVEPLVTVVKEGKKIQKLFYSAPVQKLFLSKVRGKSGLVAYYFENMVENYRSDYRDLHRLLRDYKDR